VLRRKSLHRKAEIRRATEIKVPETDNSPKERRRRE
jgi:hypothetical protein